MVLDEKVWIHNFCFKKSLTMATEFDFVWFRNTGIVTSVDASDNRGYNIFVHKICGSDHVRRDCVQCVLYNEIWIEGNGTVVISSSSLTCNVDDVLAVSGDRVTCDTPCPY